MRRYWAQGAMTPRRRSMVSMPGLALTVVVEQIPLVEQHHDGAAALDGQAHDLLVLLGDAYGGVDDEQRHVGAVDGTQAADHGVVLDVLVHGALLANARGVDHAVVLAVALDHGVDGIARGAGNVRHDGAVGSQDAVEQRRLTGVGAADDSDVQRVGEFIGDLVLFLGEQATISSSRSPVPCPCRADSGVGSPMPSE